MSIPDMTRHSRGSGVKFLAQAGRRTIAAPTQPKRLGCEGHAAPAKDAMAFSSEMDSGFAWRKRVKSRAWSFGSDSIRTGYAPAIFVCRAFFATLPSGEEAALPVPPRAA
jgi:hypothetical protein